MHSLDDSQVLTLMRSEGFTMQCACAEPELLPQGIPALISTYEIGPVPKTKDGSVPKLKVRLHPTRAQPLVSDGGYKGKFKGSEEEERF
eukprot:731512-Pyramimonas_sp.AAC.2